MADDGEDHEGRRSKSRKTGSPEPPRPSFSSSFLTVASIFRVKRLDVLRSDDNNLTGQKSATDFGCDLSICLEGDRTTSILVRN